MLVLDNAVKNCARLDVSFQDHHVVIAKLGQCSGQNYFEALM
jgi:hypothetical protein